MDHFVSASSPNCNGITGILVRKLERITHWQHSPKFGPRLIDFHLYLLGFDIHRESLTQLLGPLAKEYGIFAVTRETPVVSAPDLVEALLLARRPVPSRLLLGLHFQHLLTAAHTVIRFGFVSWRRIRAGIHVRIHCTGRRAPTSKV